MNTLSGQYAAVSQVPPKITMSFDDEFGNKPSYNRYMTMKLSSCLRSLVPFVNNLTKRKIIPTNFFENNCRKN